MANNPHQYKTGGSTSTIDAGGAASRQLQEQYYQKKALVEARKEQFFQPLADVTDMPKHFGKKIVRYHYIPLLDDANVNDQGIDASGAVITNGNLYGSSKDIGTIPGKLPTLSETGGRVNRVGFSRKVIEGSFANFGFFSEYTEDSLNFDTDAELLQHINRETINGANEITEDQLQIDLINAAGVVRYTGSATSTATVDEVVTYQDLIHLGIDLDNNRTPKQLTMLTGTRLTDTRTIPNARALFVGSELLPTLYAMKDLHNQPAFIHAHQYAAGTTIMNGEVGSIGMFRVINVPEMLKWAGGGVSSTDPDWYISSGKKDVFPMLVVGEGSFTTIGFQTDGKSVKFKQMHKKPDIDYNDPYGKTGVMSIQWWYGFMALRPERIALIKTAAKK